jgi:hypothetical protein
METMDTVLLKIESSHDDLQVKYMQKYLETFLLIYKKKKKKKKKR